MKSTKFLITLLQVLILGAQLYYCYKAKHKKRYQERHKKGHLNKGYLSKNTAKYIIKKNLDKAFIEVNHSGYNIDDMDGLRNPQIKRRTIYDNDTSSYPSQSPTFLIPDNSFSNSYTTMTTTSNVYPLPRKSYYGTDQNYRYDNTEFKEFNKLNSETKNLNKLQKEMDNLDKYESLGNVLHTGKYISDPKAYYDPTRFEREIKKNELQKSIDYIKEDLNKPYITNIKFQKIKVPEGYVEATPVQRNKSQDATGNSYSNTPQPFKSKYIIDNDESNKIQIEAESVGEKLGDKYVNEYNQPASNHFYEEAESLTKKVVRHVENSNPPLENKSQPEKRIIPETIEHIFLHEHKNSVKTIEKITEKGEIKSKKNEIVNISNNDPPLKKENEISQKQFLNKKEVVKNEESSTQKKSELKNKEAFNVKNEITQQAFIMKKEFETNKDRKNETQKKVETVPLKVENNMEHIPITKGQAVTNNEISSKVEEIASKKVEQVPPTKKDVLIPNNDALLKKEILTSNLIENKKESFSITKTENPKFQKEIINNSDQKETNTPVNALPATKIENKVVINKNPGNLEKNTPKLNNIFSAKRQLPIRVAGVEAEMNGEFEKGNKNKLEVSGIEKQSDKIVKESDTKNDDTKSEASPSNIKVEVKTQKQNIEIKKTLPENKLTTSQQNSNNQEKIEHEKKIEINSAAFSQENKSDKKITPIESTKSKIVTNVENSEKQNVKQMKTEQDNLKIEPTKLKTELQVSNQSNMQEHNHIQTIAISGKENNGELREKK